MTKSGPSAALFSTSPHAVTPGQPPNDDSSESKGEFCDSESNYQ